MRWLTALPVYNEAKHLGSVLDLVVKHSPETLVVDDGSTDETPRELAIRRDVRVVRHSKNQGYGAALMSAFDYATDHGFDVVVTIDCDGQHEPQRIGQFIEAMRGDGETQPDIVSGSRYLRAFPGDTPPPAERRRINELVTAELNRRLCLDLTDAFCGFKAYRVDALSKLDLTESGYAMPLELWAQAAKAELNVVEVPVPLIYLDEDRSFGGAMDDSGTRLEYYHLVIDRSIARVEDSLGRVRAGSLCPEGAA
ncbi:MAG: glycosyltransferase family 2 protein [Pirellulales bacterium]|nr:glycosyltransferase family 2 protein [Pirellulales bacterium]